LRPANTAFDGQEEIPTFAEVLALARDAGAGVYPELKHPTFLREQGLDPVGAFVGAVRQGGGQEAADAMFVQCFETWPLRLLAEMSSIRWSCIQLLSTPFVSPHGAISFTTSEMLTDRGLAEIATYARGVGAEKVMIMPRDSDQRSQPATDFVARAHAAGLQVHAWTFRAENFFLPLELRRGDADAPDYLRQHGDLDAELRAFYAAGVDGVFSDFPAAAVAARA
jgi:glycerophosphoryl diester phosphodiesterase